MNKRIRFLSLNIGNPSLERAKKQCEWLKQRPEDVFVLTETKNSKGCSYLEEFFLRYGESSASHNIQVNFPKSNTGDRGVMIISKYPIIKSTHCFTEDSIFYTRQLETLISVNDRQIGITGLYVPSRDRSDEKVQRKKAFISEIEKVLNASASASKIIMGDLNILDRKHIPHYSSFFEWEYQFYDEIIKKGYVDVYQHCNPQKQEYSWVGRTKAGYRYDYGFVSEDLKDSIVSCGYIHETRKNGLTDHSAIVMELEL